MAEDKLNIHQRINEVRKKVEYIKRDKEVQGYTVVTHDMVTATIRKHLIEQGILIVPTLVTSTTVQDTGLATGKGAPIIRYEAKFKVEFINVDDPNDKLSIHVSGHALDQGDKTPGKCVSYATKTAMLKVFSLETGDDEESRAHDPIDAALEKFIQAEASADWATCCEIDMNHDLCKAVTQLMNNRQKKSFKELVTKRAEYRDLVNDLAEREDADGVNQIWDELSSKESGLVWKTLTENTRKFITDIRKEKAA